MFFCRKGKRYRYTLSLPLGTFCRMHLVIFYVSKGEDRYILSSRPCFHLAVVLLSDCGYAQLNVNYVVNEDVPRQAVKKFKS